MQIERETNAVIGGKNVSAERSSGGRSGSSGGPTVAVVSLVVALRGDAMKRLGLDKSVSNMSGEIRWLFVFRNCEINVVLASHRQT